MTYDLHCGLVLMSGGTTNAGGPRDLWTWDGSEWTEVLTDLPFSAFTSAFAYFPPVRQAIHYGGDRENEQTYRVWTPCEADLTGSSDPGASDYGVPDGDADGDDFFFFLDAFQTMDLGICDLTGSSNPLDPTWSIPDDDCDGDDFFYYLDQFTIGCG